MGLLDYARPATFKAATFNYVAGPMFQKLSMWDLPAADELAGDVKGLTAVVTGPTSGIGEATAAVLARRGAHVVLACRSRSKGEALAKRLAAEAAAAGAPSPSLEVMQLDLDSLESVRAFVAAWNAAQRPLHLLLNNAGVFNMGVARATTADGFESHMGTNHLAHFLLTLGLLPALRRGAADPAARARLGGARVVNVSSSMLMFGAGLGAGDADPELAAEGSYRSEAAYGRSKLAQVLFARELRRRLARESDADARDAAAAAADAAGGRAGPKWHEVDGVHAEGPPRVQVYAVHPGYVLTDVVRSLPAVVQRAYRLLMSRILLTPEQGARATLFAACSPDAWRASLHTGGFFNADTRPVVLSEAMLDDAAAEWLWDWSARRVKLPHEWNLPAAHVVGAAAPAPQSSL
ncbi:hypothetical protein Rsub_13152 [Raphidocelis subcapitata]|uniref:Uncharacterized protein n=1 Tax=Raphidocelis subcapitata TaxID=307507 RepID=A0A2V0PQX0_9CHLO|nr:hypothetical protein Rsub_13152 [Raphidocelis subcapitata]|eukprot:GBG00471.1 hypothetical protein Rsub_13152 [Raphidocelis subcapitata]